MGDDFLVDPVRIRCVVTDQVVQVKQALRGDGVKANPQALLVGT